MTIESANFPTVTDHNRLLWGRSMAFDSLPAERYFAKHRAALIEAIFNLNGVEQTTAHKEWCTPMRGHLVDCLDLLPLSLNARATRNRSA